MSFERPVTRQTDQPLDRQRHPLFVATPEIRPRRRRRRWLETLLLLGFFFCLLISLAALALLWNTLRTPDRDLSNPLQSLESANILPQLALLRLVGEPADALAHQALNAGELETSRALLYFSRYTNSSDRLSLLLQLAQRLSEAGQQPEAASVYRRAYALAILDPTLNSLTRSQALIKCSEGLLAANERTSALFSARQALRISQQAPDLLPAQRSQLFNTLQPLADPLGDDSFSQQLAELVRNPFITAPGVIIQSQLWQLLAAPTTDDAVATALATRHQRARELADRIAFTGGADIDPERIALAQALLLEDQARSEALSRSQANDLSPAQRLWLLVDYRDWLLLKLQVAYQAFGLSLLPDWENDRALLERELAAATSNLDARFNALAATQPEPIDQASVRWEARLWLAHEFTRGLYPGGAPLELSQRIGQDQAELARLSQPLGLPVGYDREATPPSFAILVTP